MRNSTRIAVAATVAAAGIAVAAGPASAASAPTAPEGVSAQAQAAGVLEGNDLLVTYACTAEAVGAAVSTAITNCYLTTGGPNLSVALPGPAAAIAGVATVPLSQFKICWSAVATFVDASTRTTSGCSLIGTTADGGATSGVSESLS